MLNCTRMDKALFQFNSFYLFKKILFKVLGEILSSGHAELYFQLNCTINYSLLVLLHFMPLL